MGVWDLGRVVCLGIGLCVACGDGGDGRNGTTAGGGAEDDDAGVSDGSGNSGSSGGGNAATGGGSVPADSGLQGSKKASELARDEALALCGWIDLKAATASPLEAMCTYLALGLTEDLDAPGDASTCEGLAEECVAQGASPGGLICASTEDGAQAICIGPDPEADAEEGLCTYDGCEATVAEIEACTRVLVAALGVDVRGDSCTEVGDGQIRDQAQEQAFRGAACMTVVDKCPDFL